MSANAQPVEYRSGAATPAVAVISSNRQSPRLRYNALGPLVRARKTSGRPSPSTSARHTPAPCASWRFATRRDSLTLLVNLMPVRDEASGNRKRLSRRTRREAHAHALPVVQDEHRDVQEVVVGDLERDIGGR